MIPPMNFGKTRFHDRLFSCSISRLLKSILLYYVRIRIDVLATVLILDSEINLMCIFIYLEYIL